MTFHDRWLDLRDRLIASPAFQSWALAFPLTRVVARYRSRKLFDLCAGFVYSQVLLVCVQLRLFELVYPVAADVDELARQTGLSRERMRLVVDAATSLGLLQRRSGGQIGLGPHGAALMGNPWIAGFIEHHGAFYRDIEDPVALLRGDSSATNLGRYWAYARSLEPKHLQETEVADYTSLMGASQLAVAREIIDAVSLSRHQVLLDAGGGNGSFIAAAAKKHPHLMFLHVDLPAVCAQARVNFAKLGIEQRVTVCPADFLKDALPVGADVVTLIRIVHDHDDDAVLRLFRAIRSALPKDGRLVIAEAMSGIRGTAAVTDAYFNLYFAAMGSGRPRTPSELSRLLQQSGFSGSKLVSRRNPLVASVIVAIP